jgi:hypothetical protein
VQLAQEEPRVEGDQVQPIGPPDSERGGALTVTLPAERP